MIHSIPTGPEPTRITRSAASMASPCASSERYPAGDTTAQRGKGGLRGCRAASTGGAPFDQGRRAACSTCAGRPGGRTGRRQWPGRHAASAHGTVQRRPHLSDALGARGCAGFAATRGSGGRRRRRQQCEQQGSCEGRRAARGGGAARGGAAHRRPRGARGSSAVVRGPVGRPMGRPSRGGSTRRARPALEGEGGRGGALSDCAGSQEAAWEARTCHLAHQMTRNTVRLAKQKPKYPEPPSPWLAALFPVV